MLVKVRKKIIREIFYVPAEYEYDNIDTQSYDSSGVINPDTSTVMQVAPMDEGTTAVYVLAEWMPEFPGGDEKMKEYIYISSSDIRKLLMNEICGRVILTLNYRKRWKLE